jgi:hypothetical protein
MAPENTLLQTNFKKKRFQEEHFPEGMENAKQSFQHLIGRNERALWTSRKPTPWAGASPS